MRVICPFHGKPVIGVVLDVREGEPPVKASRMRAIETCIDDTPCVPHELLRFLQEMASYYLAPVGEVLRAALPALERVRVRELGVFDAATGPQVGGRIVQVVKPTDAPSPSQGLRGSAPKLLAFLRSVGETPVARLTDVFPNARAVVKKLAAMGLVEVTQRESAADPFFKASVPRDQAPEASEDQRRAIEALQQAIAAESSKAFLLHGVTGSGKTEVYLRAMEACLAKGRGVLVLVPEIALTPQLVSRFRARFGDELAVLHSGLSDRARYEMWKSLREDRVRVAIGARSAIFAPIPRLGLVVVDEEHDGSFKQEEGVRYHGRDMALLRAYRSAAVCVLGSATPSLETEALVRQGKLSRLSLPKRALAAAVLPAVELIDVRRTARGPSGHALVTLPVHRGIEKVLAASEQAIVFLNRRGFAPSVLCDACGTLASCPHCSVSLTLHRAGGMRLRCHYCDYETAMGTKCTKCGSERLAMVGLGTERLEESLAEAFPAARVVRLDRDVAPGARSEAVIDRMRRKQADILVGTQMVTKGHDLPHVTLVCVVNADAALALPDFRAAERTFQLLVQVAGRAGRAERPGRVMIQTRLPDHPVLQFAMTHDVAGFIEHELQARREAHYPPFARLALVRVDAADDRRARAEADRLASIASAQQPVQRGLVEVLGPSPAPLERLRGRYRHRIVLRADQRAPLRAVARAMLQARPDGDRLVRMSVDIDPVHML